MTGPTPPLGGSQKAGRTSSVSSGTEKVLSDLYQKSLKAGEKADEASDKYENAPTIENGQLLVKAIGNWQGAASAYTAAAKASSAVNSFVAKIAGQ